MVDFYIALSYIYTQSALHIISPAVLCRFTYNILFLNLNFGAYSPKSCWLYTLRVLPSIQIQAHLLLGTQFNCLGGVKCMARGSNLL